MRRFITTNSFNAVAAGQRATLELPVGAVVYHRLQLLYGTTTAGGPTQANMEAEITEVRLKINGKVQRTFSAAELFTINGVNGQAVNDGFLNIFFSEPWRRSVQGEDALAWGTQDIDTFFVEVDIDAAALNPTLQARVEIEDASRPMGPIVKWRNFSVPVTATGVRNVTTLPKQDAYYRLHAFTGDIANVAVIRDGREEVRASRAQLVELYENDGLVVPAGLTSIIFDKTQRVADGLPMQQPLAGGGSRPVSEFRVDFDMSAATTFKLVTETLGLRD